MAKISPVSIKYTIYAKFKAEGPVEKPDVIGALFGQTEGLLGSDLEMRELQKEGKIGRIEVNIESSNGTTRGEIEIPSALDKAETSLIAAAIETIERIGPTDAKIEVEKIDDVRGSKRDYIVERAKKLLGSIEGSKGTREISDSIKEGAKIDKLQEYGDEKLPAGDISGNEIIVVEGRADVINLLRNNIKNVIGMNGTRLPEAIKELSYEKELTLFVDGDRGGKLIAKNVCDNARVDFIAVAPDGKEVEELVGKEIISALRKRVKAEEFFKAGREERREYRYEERKENNPGEEYMEEKQERRVGKKAEKLSSSQKDKLAGLIEKLPSKSAVLLDESLDVVKRVSVSSLNSSLERLGEQVKTIVTNATVTSGLIRMAEELGIEHIGAKNFASTDTYIELISL